MDNGIHTDVDVDVLTATASQLREGLQNGSLTSVMIVQSYLAQVKSHNHAGANLNAMLSMPEAQSLLSIARSLDIERLAGRVRGRLHGIPIILKDAIATAPELGMETTAGSYTLKDSIPAGNAAIVDALIKHGLIVLGKANLSEFCGPKGPPGWSAVGGQTQSAYIRGGKVKGEKPGGETSPGGSSSGSAQGVAAGFSPISIGTETTGSLMNPASRAALYALKLTPGSTPPDGIFRVTETFDAIGAMSKNVEDVATLSNILQESVKESLLERRSLLHHLNTNWEAISIGFVDIEDWRLSEKDKDFDEKYNEQTKREYNLAIDRIRNLGGRVVHPIRLPKYNELQVDHTDLVMITTRAQVRPTIEKYLHGLVKAKVHTLEDIIQFNSAHPDLELPKEAPSQEELENALHCNVSEHELSRLLDRYYQIVATNGIDNAMREHNLNLVAGPADSTFVTLATGSRYPIAAVPLGYVESSGRPYGVQFIAKAGDEATLIGAMSAWERMMPARRVPDLSWAEE